MSDWLRLCVSVGVALVSISSANAQDWSVTKLGIDQPMALNNTGQVVLAGAGAVPPVITGPNGQGLTDLGALPGGLAVGLGTAINDAGQVVGKSVLSDGSQHAFLTGPNGQGMTDLGTFGYGSSIGLSVNNSGVVVGYATAGSNQSAFMTGSNGQGLIGLSVPGQNSIAFSVSDTGRVAGQFDEGGNSPAFAFVTGPGGQNFINLGVVGAAKFINNDGYAVGVMSASGYAQHAFIAKPNQQGVIDLGTLGGNSSFASGINGFGQVVGRSDVGDNSWTHAFVTGNLGVGMIDLNSKVVLPIPFDVLTNAIAINDVGQIIATDSFGYAYLLTPVPEPTSFILWWMGLLPMAVAYRRRRG